MYRPRTLTVAYTPDSDDAFYYDALETGLVRLSGCRLRFRREPMSGCTRRYASAIKPPGRPDTSTSVRRVSASSSSAV